MFVEVYVAFLICTMVEGYSIGPPTAACGSMTPGHGVAAQTSQAPYRISMNDTSYSSNSVIEVTVSATSGAFRGMFVQARRSCGNSDVAVGTFALESGETYLQLLACNGNANSAVAHRQNPDTTNKTFYWRAPAQTAGQLYFRATFVQTRPVFWTNVRSPSLSDGSSTTCSGSNSISYTFGLVAALLGLRFVY